MSNQYQELAIDSRAILSRMKVCKDVGEYRRLQVIYLRGDLKMGVEAIATATGFSASYIRSLHSAYKREGMAAIISQSKGGRYNQHLSIDQEKEFIFPFIERAKAGGILEIGVIHRELEKKLRTTINRQVTYNILHRHGWRKIAPRPKHPKADTEAQETFKKTGRQSLRKQSGRPKR